MSRLKPLAAAILLAFAMPSWAEMNTADVMQDGENNTATLEQAGTAINSQASISQLGSSHIGLSNSNRSITVRYQLLRRVLPTKGRSTRGAAAKITVWRLSSGAIRTWLP